MTSARRGRNLALNPAIVVHIERGNLAIMIEGSASSTNLDAARFAQVAEAFAAKYSYRPTSSEGWHVVRPRVVLAWDEFPKSATRFVF